MGMKQRSAARRCDGEGTEGTRTQDLRAQKGRGAKPRSTSELRRGASWEVVPAGPRPLPCRAEGRITQGWGSRIRAQGC